MYATEHYKKHKQSERAIRSYSQVISSIPILDFVQIEACLGLTDHTHHDGNFSRTFFDVYVNAKKSK